MGKWMRRIRGAIGMGLTWAAAWAAVGSVPRWVFGFNTDVPFPLVFGVLGFIGGVIFSGLLMLTEGRRGFDQMSLPRVAAWGAVGGVLLSAIFTRAASLGFGDVLAIAPTFAVASAICASGSLALARRAGMRELPGIRGDTAEVKLIDHQKRKLL
jgi:FtsH-binding integral membrane protein